MSPDTERKNKLLFLTHAGNPGGAEYKAMRLCQIIQDQVRFIHFQEGHIDAALKKMGIQHGRHNLPDKLLHFRREDGIVAIFGVIPALLMAIGGIARLCRPYGAIVCVSQKSFILAALAKPFARRPIIWLMNDIVSPAHFSRAAIFTLTKIFRFAPDCIIVNSQASLEAWRSAGGRMDITHVLYPGTDIAALDNAAKNAAEVRAFREKYTFANKPLIGVFGRISPWKGQDVFLRALAQLDDVNGVIVGGVQFDEEAYAQSLHSLVTTLGLQDRIGFTGHCDQVPIAMSACDIIVHCSTAAEPFGGVIVEAMAAHRPVIVSDAGGAREIISSTEVGMRTPVKDDVALAAAIQTILDRPGEDTLKVIRAARQRVEEVFSSDVMAQNFVEIVKDCLD